MWRKLLVRFTLFAMMQSGSPPAGSGRGFARLHRLLNLCRPYGTLRSPVKATEGLAVLFERLALLEKYTNMMVTMENLN